MEHGCFYEDRREIAVPGVSLSRVADWITGGYVPLVDVVRHEYAHALAAAHRGLIRSARFRHAFRAPHDSDRSRPFDPAQHVTSYAATSPQEDFAETAMVYIRQRGRMPRSMETYGIGKRWAFVRAFARAIAAGRRRR